MLELAAFQCHWIVILKYLSPSLAIPRGHFSPSAKPLHSRMISFVRFAYPCLHRGLTSVSTVKSFSTAASSVVQQKVSPAGSTTGYAHDKPSATALTPSGYSSFADILRAGCGGEGDKVYEDLARRSIDAYRESREIVDAKLLPILEKHRIVLLMEGTVDAPKSKLSMNVVKMLTQLQGVPMVAIDVTAHPAIFGFALTHGKKGRSPYLFVDGVCLGSHDNVMQMYYSGALAKQLKGSLPKGSSTFTGELPIALY